MIKGSAFNVTKLSQEQVEKIRALVPRVGFSLTHRDIARRFNVSVGTIHKIARGEK